MRKVLGLIMIAMSVTAAHAQTAAPDDLKETLALCEKYSAMGIRRGPEIIKLCDDAQADVRAKALAGSEMPKDMQRLQELAKRRKGQP